MAHVLLSEKGRKVLSDRVLANKIAACIVKDGKQLALGKTANVISGLSIRFIGKAIF